jgi:prophage tail gpP-like protein
MQDKVELLVNDKLIKDFKSYSIESDLFKAADDFSLELVNPNVRVNKGDKCKLYVNAILELNGIIDTVNPSYDKEGSSLKVGGRDLMGQVVDAYCEDFDVSENIKLKELTEKLLRKVKFINLKNIEYGKGSKDLAVPLNKSDEEFEDSHVKPGSKVFDVLSRHALSRGLLFFSKPDGTFVYGTPVTSGKAVFSIVKGNNVKKGSLIKSISSQYSTVTVMGQKTNVAAWENDNVNYSVSVENPDFPAGFHKPFITVLEGDGREPKKQARLILDHQRFESFQLEYTVPGHSQRGRNWQANAICHVKDDHPNIEFIGNMMIYSRIFQGNKDEGSTTTLKLSRLGVVPA